MKLVPRPLLNPNDFQGVHEEVDTLLAFHASKTPGKVIVRTSDMDVLVILLGMKAKHEELEIQVPYESLLMDVGQENNQRYVNVSDIFKEIENHFPGMSAAMIGIHAKTGSDFTSAFYKKK